MSRKLLQYFALLVCLMIASAGQAAPAAPDPPSNDDCLKCHGNLDASAKFTDGETLSLYVDSESFAHSVHGGKLACTNCHTNITAVPHAARQFKDRRAMDLAYYESCKQCHFAEYTRLLDGVHYAALEKGKEKAPTCVDCHGSHAMGPPAKPRMHISETCAKCHTAVGAAYARSAHAAGLAKGNPDVPVCTDCHHAHDNANPMTTASHLRISELCARCHTNEKLMAKYGISTDVLTTYLADFHGLTASLYRSEGMKPAALTATCTDCHGVHDITWVKGPGSGVIKANLLIRCQHCHKGAGPNFSSAWMGHYEPSLRHAPLVYLVKLFYMIFIPFVVGGLIIQILLHLWRVVVNI
ncbi:MAG: cytochrome c3 family protein [Candidatus Binatus sp.]|jgi:predicted CXXCH cytochrome family protein